MPVHWQRRPTPLLLLASARASFCTYEIVSHELRAMALAFVSFRVGLAERVSCAVTVRQALKGSADKNGKVGTVSSCARGVVGSCHTGQSPGD